MIIDVDGVNDYGTGESNNGSCQNMLGVERNSVVYAKRVRDTYKDYFMSNAGSVPWQNVV